MVSVIIVNYNTFEYTKKCIQSVIDKTKHIELEIIVVSNSSVDHDINQLSHLFPGIQVIINKENVGFAKANNIGISKANGEYILLLNSDTELLNDAINASISIFKSQSDVSAVAAQLQYPNGELQPNAQSFPSIAAEFLETSRFHKFISKEKFAKKYKNAMLNFETNHYCDWIWGTYFLFRKSDLGKLEMGMLSERFFMYGEDMEWCYQFKLAGLRCYFCADAKVLHHMGKSQFGNKHKVDSAIINHEIEFLRIYKGTLYAYSIRIIKIIKYLVQSIKTKKNFALAMLYLNPKQS